MPYSMTGFGRGEAQSDTYRFIVEIRSINHRYCDINIKMPRIFGNLEDKLRRMIQGQINRGKLDIYVSYEEFGDKPKAVTIDRGLAEAYYNGLKALKDQFDIIDDISLTSFLRIPDIMKTEKLEIDEEQVWNVLQEAVQNALKFLMDMREREGQKLVMDIQTKLKTISAEVIFVEERAPLIVEEYKVKLEARIKEILQQTVPDETRLAGEVALFAERCSVDEEIVRLKSHLIQMEKCCESDQPIGRKLDFIIQELNREINTIGSKSNDLDINNRVVDIKSEIEKIREQTQNLE